MPVMELTVKVSVSDSFKVEIEDDETVEALSVVIFSVRPDLGDELRLVHKGRVLKNEAVVTNSGLKSGDIVVVAKLPTAAPVAEAKQAEPAAAEPAAAEHSAAQPAAAESVAAESAAEPAQVVAPAAATAAEAAAAEASPATEAQEDQDEQRKEEAAAPSPPKFDPPPRAAAEAAATAAAIGAPSTRAEAEKDGAAGGENAASAASVTGEVEAAEALAAAAEDVAEAEINATSEAGLLELAARLERGGPPPSPEKLAAAMRQAAQKMAAVDQAFVTLANAMQVVHVMSAKSLQQAMSTISGAPGVEGPGSEHASSDGHPAFQQESTRSFLIKKGDVDVQELHRSVSSGSGRDHASIGGSGVLSSSTAPLTREEMDKARNARLAKLEAQQAEKQKEKEEAEEKGRAREALSNRHLVGPAKQLGSK